MSETTTLITGGAGFIGSHLASHLLAGRERVIIIENFDSFYGRDLKERNLAELPTGRLTLIEADIRDRDRILEIFSEHQPQRVFHLAALAGVRPSIEAPDRYVAVNLDGTINLLDGAIGSGCRRFIFASSSSVYGNNRTVPFAETDPVDEPISPYAATKRAGELLCHTYSHLHQLPIACLRFFTVFGPRQRPDLAISKFMRLIAASEPVPMFGDGTTSRDYTFIDDIIAGVEAASQRIGDPDIGLFRIWNLGGSEPVTLREMIDAISRVVGREAKIDQRPMQPGDVERTYADLSRSRQELGFQPQTPFIEGLKRQWAWLCDAEPGLASGASVVR